MMPHEVTTEWLKQQTGWQVQPANKVTIQGVYLKELVTHLDGRGDVTELWSVNWKDEGIVQPAHVYQSATDYGVIKCWHLHEKHTDQFTVTRGKLQVSMIDIREDSPTFLHVNTVFLGSLKPRYLRIVPGIMHGWKALTEPETIVVNLQSEVYDPVDEFKFPWDCVLKEVWQPVNG
ncbi:MAG: dTDP-4-dehydrorhamnose 3,5-epimerase family protein [Candidatus Pacebacteria bacterium]|nr:dTDP-4-dehydrorhamnose 3,5-epimerase family protein [Candidatus Paceibacterota bacterium]